MPVKTFNSLSADYHDQMLFMQDLASALMDPKQMNIVLAGAATMWGMWTPFQTAQIVKAVLANGSVNQATATNTTAIAVEQYDNVTPTKVGNTIASKAAGTALTAGLSAVMALSATLTDMVIAPGNSVRVTKTVVGTQADCAVMLSFFDVVAGFIPS